MKVLKVFLAVILSFLLLCAQGALMGVIACNEAISSDSIAKAVQETDFTNQISQQALDAASRQADENADEKVSEFLNEAMQTDAASEFIGQYTASAIQSALQGENFSRFTKQDLLDLTDESLDELSAESGLSISDSQKEQVRNYVEENGDELVQDLNSSLPVSQNPMAPNSSQSELSQAQTFLGSSMQLVLAAICLILGIMLIMLFWGSKLGFIWWAVVSFLAGAVCLLAANADAHLTDFVRSMADESDAVSRLAAQIISEGLQFSGFAALILTAVLIVICLLCRLLSRKRA
ncbi:hypothetical protein [Zhenpiania hominis]|uniref:Uncharacterized protein n=1 Tax=Zhenpiania hominis TaxID=2763644 RepID=A0A923ST24_9FIRM|nr:hypothetical protein [Zhenpiania hominis]MBC6680984.1 hypothetical protein [Zhenpiania hominis]